MVNKMSEEIEKIKRRLDNLEDITLRNRVLINKIFNEERFICERCQITIYSSDYDYKDYNLFKSLKEHKVCEECYRIKGVNL